MEQSFGVVTSVKLEEILGQVRFQIFVSDAVVRSIDPCLAV
jgi:hypothetical protein